MGKVTSVGKTTDGKKRREKKTTTDDVVDVGWAKKNFWATTNGPGLSAGTGTGCLLAAETYRHCSLQDPRFPACKIRLFTRVPGVPGLQYQDPDLSQRLANQPNPHPN
ncbi:hypothetical protein BDBG_00387 [Blastomyces gilchristii SLH14081]|uniref:Uncharacterized protein n=1 Tax=Blastomyces gilchristii (strain SLH14081) TaxID=559298 RepID=A0A179U963_BLAGS|nr:uncharacterized protein BDBG_00387 [Blastomyces gilchristii SLH14081]OAT03697.1 hypothetical protein BDBG_00387 [Blastomyces gilchristii SLH14081]